MKFLIKHSESDSEFIEEFESEEAAYEAYQDIDVTIERKKMEMTKEQKREKVIALLLSTNREGMQELINWMNEKGFFTSPAAMSHHSNYDGGLVDHSINIYNTYVKLCNEYKLEVPRETKIIAAFCHDLCKVGLYIGENGRYVYNNSVGSQGHGVLSLVITRRFLKLTELEEKMIQFHMGMYTKDSSRKDLEDAFNDIKVKLFYFADEIACHLMEKIN
jgi:hypothetical protein